MKKLILITAITTGLFANECSWNINKTAEEMNKTVISMQDNDYYGIKYHLDMALLYNMDSIIKCDPVYKEQLMKTRQNLLQKKERYK